MTTLLALIGAWFVLTFAGLVGYALHCEIGRWRERRRLRKFFHSREWP